MASQPHEDDQDRLPPEGEASARGADPRTPVEMERENEALRRDLAAARRELSEALEHQTATAEILRVMSQSPADFQPVFDAMAEGAMRVCAADGASIWLLEGDEDVAAATTARSAFRVGDRVPNVPGMLGYLVREQRQALQVRNLAADPLLAQLPVWLDLLRPRYPFDLSVLYVPMLRQGAVIGFVAVGRFGRRGFTEK